MKSTGSLKNVPGTRLKKHDPKMQPVILDDIMDQKKKSIIFWLQRASLEQLGET